MSTIELSVSGLSCGGCVKRMSTALQGVVGVHEVVVSEDRTHVAIVGDELQRDTLVQVIRDTGYQVVDGNDIPLQGL
jgi:copper chaperone